VCNKLSLSVARRAVNYLIFGGDCIAPARVAAARAGADINNNCEQ
jgi:hypothetical protein